MKKIWMTIALLMLTACQAQGGIAFYSDADSASVEEPRCLMGCH